MATERQVAANRENGLKGGVKTEEGKAISRLNARKHGIFATALTPEDSEDLQGIEDRLAASLRPEGAVQEMLVEKLALIYLRMQRCARAEAEYHVKTWQEPDKKRDRSEWDDLQRARRHGARVVCFKAEVFERMVKLIDMYDTRLTKQFLKLIHEIKQMQGHPVGREAAAERRQMDNRSAELPHTPDCSDVATKQHSDCQISPETATNTAPEPTETETSAPPSQPSVAQPPSAVTTLRSNSAQPGATVPHGLGQVQVVEAEESDA